MTLVPQGPVARITDEELADGFVPLIGEWENGGFNKHGWNHYGPGWFTLDHETGVLASHGGMGLLWYSAEMFGDFVLRLEFNTSVPDSNSGIFLRVPEMVTSDEYIYHSFEIQIHATAPEAIHRTGAVYDAEAPGEDRAKAPGEWNEMEISFVGDRITVSLNGAQVTDWVAEPRGKIRDFASRGIHRPAEPRLGDERLLPEHPGQEAGLRASEPGPAGPRSPTGRCSGRSRAMTWARRRSPGLRPGLPCPPGAPRTAFRG